MADFKSAMNVVAKTLNNIKISIETDGFDGLIVKELKASNTLDKNRTTKQSHIAITGPQMDMFPYIRANGYFDVEYSLEDDELKKYFVAQIPVNLYKSNVNYLDTTAEFFSESEMRVHVSIVRSRRKDAADQIQMSMTYMDSPQFIEFRKIVHEGSYMVMLKRKEELLYDMYAIKPEDVDDEFKKLNNAFFKQSTNTTVKVDELLSAKEPSDDNKKIEKKIIYKTGYSSEFERNRIVFGAPGTGKSFKINKECAKLIGDNNETDYERVTFHPDYSYANFVGTYKPVMKKYQSRTHTQNGEKEVIDVLKDTSLTAQDKYDLLYDKFKGDGLTRLPILLGLYTDENFETKKADGTPAVNDNSVERNHGRAIRPYVCLDDQDEVKEEISYEYVPGPFMRVLVKALKSAMTDNPQPYLLIIEEINRANVAAVFGDIFQLLDRGDDNCSEYPIEATEDMKKYLSKELELPEECFNKIRIPDNMFIWATMNSADQGVFPMDTAFKRRWDFTYIGIDDNDKDLQGKTVILGSKVKQKVEWNTLRKAINNFLAKQKINEDKQLGPYFISRKIVVPENGNEIDSEKFVKVFKNKVIMYLFEDAAKQKRATVFEGCFQNSTRYSEICREFDEKGIGIFNHDIQLATEPEDINENVEENKE